MHQSHQKILEHVYSKCCSILHPDSWDHIVTACSDNLEPGVFLKNLVLRAGESGIPEFLPDLARLEWAISEVSTKEPPDHSEVNEIKVNPTLQLLNLSWKYLPRVFDSEEISPMTEPQQGKEFVLVWRPPQAGKARIKTASDEDLLVLKMIVEKINLNNVAVMGDLPVSAVDSAIYRAVKNGILIAPQPLIRPDPAGFQVTESIDEAFLSTSVFTLQWHITQDCDLHCKHCYDRSQRGPLAMGKAIKILDDLRTFCQGRYVRGQVTFTGGNPLLYPHFLEIYRTASEKGFTLAILGNPAPRKQIEEIIAIQRPVFFQVSLEGLQEHNDDIRGRGHFNRAINFLEVLRELEVSSMVMLTLTKSNIDQVLPLADMLQGFADDFTFNRLSLVGKGAALELPDKRDFIRFLEEYVDAAKQNPIIGLKDNLINVVLHQRGMAPFGGCTGYGCGAAFNFISLLSDGEAHACRKFPSPIGNAFEQSIEEIYKSKMAHLYRSGCKGCRSCAIRPVCGGCLAVAHSHGLNVLEQHDPYCFM